MVLVLVNQMRDFTLKITGATNGQLEGGASELIATGTITDNDNNTALPVIRIDNPSMSEGIARNQLTFEVSISDSLSDDVDLTYTTSNGSAIAGEDYSAVTTPQEFSIPAGQLKKHNNCRYH